MWSVATETNDRTSARQAYLEAPEPGYCRCRWVGYDVTISVPTFSELPALSVEVSFFIHTHVREDTLALFGFLRAGEKQLFEKLLSVSGIGPKLAITILSGMPVDAMIAAIKGNNVAPSRAFPVSAKKPLSAWCWNCVTSWMPSVSRLRP